MVSLKKVNKAIQDEFPDMDISLVRGAGYFYFVGDDGMDLVESIFCQPSTAVTDNLIDEAITLIRMAHGG